MNAPTTLRTTGISAARDYKDLPAWQRAITLAEKIYAVTESFPEREYAGLASSMRMSAVGIAANIAAGSGRTNEQGVADSYSKAQSTNAELSTQFELAKRLGYSEENAEVSSMLDEISRLIVGMKHGLKVEAKDNVRAERDQGKRDREYKERTERPREFKPREDRGDRKPRGEYKPRDDRGEYKPRGEFKPREDRGDRKPRGEFKPRDDRGERKPKGEWKPREDRGDRKPRGEYKPRDGGGRSGGGGDRPYRKPFKKD
jgi:four helix bundle protein